MTATPQSAYGSTPNPPDTPYRPGTLAPDDEPGTQPAAPQDPDLLPDPAPGSEPRTEPDDRAGQPLHSGQRLATQALGAAAGAAGGLVAGAVAGIAAGPVGSLAGAAAGAVLGGMAGAGAGIDDGQASSAWADEDFWRESFTSRAYVARDASFDDYGPAYRYGAEAYARHAPMGAWTEAEARLGMGWEAARGTSKLRWTEARHAARDAWERMKRNTAGPR